MQVVQVFVVFVYIFFWFLNDWRSKLDVQTVYAEKKIRSMLFRQRETRKLTSKSSSRREIKFISSKMNWCRNYVREKFLNKIFEQWIAKSNATTKNCKNDDEIRRVKSKSKKRHSSSLNDERSFQSFSFRFFRQKIK